MSSVELDYTRALLVAQTDGPEPEAQGLLGRLFRNRPEPRRRPHPSPRFAGPLHLAASHPTEAPAAADFAQELLLEHMRRPPRAVETASPPQPPTLRGEFGRRPDIAPDLVLDQPATKARRLQLFAPSGQPVGEMILPPDPPQVAVVPSMSGEEAPYFPEDLLGPDHAAKP